MVARALRRPLRSAAIAIVLILAFIFLSPDRRRVVQPELFNLGGSGPRPLSPVDASALCKAHGFRPYLHPGRKVYDLFLFNHEKDWLNIRLNSLSPYVDYFVIIEGKRSFINLPKTTILHNNWDNYTAFHSKMLNYVIEDTVNSARSWDHEDFFRNAMLYKTFPHMRGGEKQAFDRQRHR